VCCAACRGLSEQGLELDLTLFWTSLTLAIMYCFLQSVIDDILNSVSYFQTAVLCCGVVTVASGIAGGVTGGGGSLIGSVSEWVCVSSWLAYLLVWLLKGTCTYAVHVGLSIHANGGSSYQYLDLQNTIGIKHGAGTVDEETCATRGDAAHAKVAHEGDTQVVLITLSRRFVSTVVILFVIWPVLFLGLAYLLSYRLNVINSKNLLISTAISTGIPHSIGIIGMTGWALCFLMSCNFRLAHVNLRVLDKPASNLTSYTWLHSSTFTAVYLIGSCGLLVCGTVEDRWDRKIHTTFSSLAMGCGNLLMFYEMFYELLLQEPKNLNAWQCFWTVTRCSTCCLTFLVYPMCAYFLFLKDWVQLGEWELFNVGIMTLFWSMWLLPTWAKQDDFCCVDYDVRIALDS